MCVISMVIDAKAYEWDQRYFQIPAIPYPPMPTRQELDEFHRLLARAREYDKKHGEPDCEIEEKKAKLKAMADELGVAIEFVRATP